MAEIYKTIVEQEESTVIAHYEPTERDRTAYQGETAMENKLINQLVEECAKLYKVGRYVAKHNPYRQG